MAGRGIRLPIIGDPSSLIRALKRGKLSAADFAGNVKKSGALAAEGLKQGSVAANALAIDMDKVTLAAEKSVKVQVAAELKRTARLRAEIKLFNEQAAAAKRGSQQQILAANLSARAQRELSSSLGITSREAAKLQRSSGAANHELNRGFRGALAGSGIFQALGRSLAFASGGFLIFATASNFIRSSVDAARDALKTQRALAAQYQASGQSLKPYQKEIEETVDKTSRLAGFTRDELTRAFIVAYRQTNQTAAGLRVMSDAAEVARGRHLPLWTSVLALTKAYGGQTTALRRLGILIPAHTKGIAALQYVEHKFGGQLRANTTAAERAGSSLHNLEEVAGKALLPTITSLQARFARWASQTKNQVFVQNQLRDVLRGVGGAITFLYKIAAGFAMVFGGWKNAIVAIAGAWVALKIKGVASATVMRGANLKAAFDSVRAWKAAGVGIAVSAEAAEAKQVAAQVAAAASAKAQAAATLAANVATQEGTVAATEAAAVANVAATEAAAAAMVAANEAAAAASAAAWRAALLSTGIGALVVAAGTAAALIMTHWSGVKSIFSGPDGLQSEVEKLTGDFYDLARTAGKSGDLAQAKLARAQAKVSVDEAQHELKAAKAAELAARGTNHHAEAVDRLRLAQQQLVAAQGALADATGSVGTSADAQRKKIAALVREFAHVSEATYVLTHAGPGVGKDTGGGKFTGAPKDTVQSYVKNLQDAIDKGVSPQVFKILRALQEVALYKKDGSARKLTSLDTPTTRDVRFVVTTVLNDKGKVVDLVKLMSKGGTLSAQLLGPALSLLNPSKAAPAGPKSVFDGLQPPEIKPIKDFQKWLDHNFALMAAIASSTTAGGDDIRVARQEAHAIREAIKEHRLHGKELVAAYQELGSINSILAGDAREAASFGEKFDRKFALAIAKASATATQSDDRAAARAARQWVRALISSGTLNRKQLVDAYTELATLNSQLAGAASEAAQKTKQARDDLRTKVTQAVSQIGTLFQGPILSPTDTQIKQQLGVLPPTVGTINRDLSAQNALSRAWLKDIQKLKREGAPKQLIQELLQAGPEQAQYVHQLATASKKQLQRFFRDYQQRIKLGVDVALIKMTARNIDLVAKNVTFKGGVPVPKMAAGGIVTRPTYALIGEAGPEAVIPLSRGASGPHLGALRLRAGRTHLPAASTIVVPNGGGDNQPIVLEVDGDVMARSSLRRHQRKAKRQVVQVRGRRGGSNLALG